MLLKGQKIIYWGGQVFNTPDGNGSYCISRARSRNMHNAHYVFNLPIDVETVFSPSLLDVKSEAATTDPNRTIKCPNSVNATTKTC